MGYESIQAFSDRKRDLDPLDCLPSSVGDAQVLLNSLQEQVQLRQVL